MSEILPYMPCTVTFVARVKYRLAEEPAAADRVGPIRGTPG